MTIVQLLMDTNSSNFRTNLNAMLIPQIQRAYLPLQQTIPTQVQIQTRIIATTTTTATTASNSRLLRTVLI
jgi:hypothetical protein